MSDEKLDAYRTARKSGDPDAYLDSLGREAAAAVAPDFVELAETALSLVPGKHERRGGSTSRRRNPDYQPGLFDTSGGLMDLMGQMAFLEYEIGGEIYTHDELIERLDLLAKLEEQRRREAQTWQDREDLARSEKDAAFKDANILLVVRQRLQGDAA